MAAIATPCHSACSVHARRRLAAVGATLQVSPSSKRTVNNFSRSQAAGEPSLRAFVRRRVAGSNALCLCWFCALLR
jgi:hypothetical protein